MARIDIVKGDITTQEGDAIVNAANSRLAGGGGVDGAIHRAGGAKILEECRAIVERLPGNRLPTGQAVATGAGDLPARWVIHTIGPIYADDPDPAGSLASCHTESLRVADELGATTVAFPAISTGVYGYPPEEAAPVALGAVTKAKTDAELIRFVLLDEPATEIYRRAAERLGL